MQIVTSYSRIDDLSGLTVNSVTWIELAIGSKSPASLYISSMKATHDVDFPSLYSQSSCSGIVSNSSKDDPRFSISTRTSGRLRFCTKHEINQIIKDPFFVSNKIKCSWSIAWLPTKQKEERKFREIDPMIFRIRELSTYNLPLIYDGN